MQAADFHRQGFRLQARAVAGRAGAISHVALDFLARPGRVRLFPAAFEVRDHAFESFGGFVGAQAVIILEGDFLGAGAVENGLLGVFGNVAPAVARLEAIDLAECFERLRIVG